MVVSLDENPLTMVEETHETKTLEFGDIDVPTMEETPRLEFLGIESPSSNSRECDQALGGSSQIGGTHLLKTLEESTRVEVDIEDAHEHKTLEKLSEVEIEDTQNPKIIDKSSQFVIDDLRKVLEPSVEEEKIHGEKQDKPLSSDDDDGDNDDDFKEKLLDLHSSPRDRRYEFLCHRERCHCGSLCRRRFQGFHCSPNVQTYFMCQCGDPHCENSEPFLVGRDPNFMGKFESPYLMNRSRFPVFAKNEKGKNPFWIRKWNEPEPFPVGAGLANMGNTCFLNAIMQCFTHTVPLVQGLQSLKHESSSHSESEFCVLCAVRDQIEHSIAYSGMVIQPSDLVNNLSHISSFFRRYQQEDAQEFLQCLLDKLDSNWLKYDANAKDSSSSDDSLVKQVFGGRLVSQVCCSKCGHISDTFEPVVDLSLEIEDVDNLESALKSFTKVESIEDTEKFTCGGCKERVQVEKQLMLDRAPPIASFHLKRFKSDGIFVQKVDRTVAYPLELDLQPYIKGTKDGNEELKYDLFAVVVHVGLSATSGHYFCYIRPAPDTWYLFDDSQVTGVGEEDVLYQDAYILFYAKKGTAWFSSLIDKWKANAKEKISNTSPTSVLDEMGHRSTSDQLGAGLDVCDVVAAKNNTAGGSSTEPSGGLSTRDEVEINAWADSRDSVVLANRPSCMPSSSEPCSSHDEVKVVENANGIEDGTGRISGEISHGDVDVEDISLSPCTVPTSSQSRPEEEGPEEASHIQPAHMNPRHNAKRKEASKHMTSKSMSMATGRRHLLMTALNKRKRKKASSFLRTKLSPRKRAKISLRRLVRSVLA